MKHVYAAMVLLVVGCQTPTGRVGERCNPDGSCLGPNLECVSWAGNYVCRTKHVKGRCTFESECFCMTCSEKCGEAGVARCSYSDTSVWGSVPATCECK